MALNISIDVDGTLLDANGELVPRALESLQRLKAAGYCLQLWSGGGADYAHRRAVEHNLTGFFESYAKKADIAIDDLPHTARPLAVIHVDQEHTLEQAANQVLGIEPNVDAALTLNDALVSFVQGLQAETGNVKKQYRDILRKDIPLHPVPFSGASSLKKPGSSLLA